LFRHLLIARWPRRSGMRAETQRIANSIVDRSPDVRRSAWAEEHFFGRALYRLPRGTLTPTDYCVDITKRRSMPDAVQAVEIHHDLAALRIDVYVRGSDVRCADFDSASCRCHR
jgi:hypothetical protein